MREELFEAVTALRAIDQSTDRVKLAVLAVHMRSLSGQGSAAEFTVHATEDIVGEALLSLVPMSVASSMNEYSGAFGL